MSSARLEGLDLFRGLAAICVVAFHFWWGLHIPEPKFGFLAVDLFFVLSGIVLGRTYEQKILGGMSFRVFAWQRLRRLYPMLLIVTVAILALDALGAPPSIGSTTSFGPAICLPLLIPYSDTFGSGGLFEANGPVWSLWAELVVNVIWFFALRAGRRFTSGLFAVTAVLLFLIACRVGTIQVGWQSGFSSMALALVRALPWFGLGYAIAVRKTQPVAPGWVSLLCLVAACALVQTGRVGFGAEFLVVLSGAALMLNLIHWTPAGGLVSNVCVRLGMVSYPLYLTHMVAARVAIWAMSHGVGGFVAYILAVVIGAIAATMLNEWVIRRLPRHLPERSGGLQARRSS